MKRTKFVDGGPLDGTVRFFMDHSLPADGWEITVNAHSYTFDAAELKFRYRGRWQNITIGNSLLTYRTFGEALRQLCQLQAVGAISQVESLEYQAQIKKGLFCGHVQ